MSKSSYNWLLNQTPHRLLKKCQRCGDNFHPEMGEDDYGPYVVSTKLCYDCFECGVEEHEEKKRERIARGNEY